MTVSLSSGRGDPMAQLEGLERELGRRPALPLIALGLTGFGLILLVVLTIIAGVAYADNWGAGGDAARSAATFKPWFRMALLTAMGIMLTGIITMLLAIIARIWWVTTSNRMFFPVIVDARRGAEGRASRFVRRRADDKGGA